MFGTKSIRSGALHALQRRRQLNLELVPLLKILFPRFRARRRATRVEPVRVSGNNLFVLPQLFQQLAGFLPRPLRARVLPQAPRLLAATALAAPLIAALTARLVAPAARLARRLVAEPLELTIERRQLLTEPSYARQLLAQLLRGLTVATCSSEPIRQAIEPPCNRLAFTLCGRLSPTRRIARLPVGARGVAHTLRQPLFVEILGSLAQCIFLPLVGFA